MLGVGWTEMLVIGVVALIVIGPKELPALMQKIGRFAGTVRRMGQDFQRELNKTTGLDEVKNLRSAITQPLKETTDAIRREFNTVSSTGSVQPSGALKPADPKAGSVVSEIKAAAGMTAAEPIKGAPVKAAAVMTSGAASGAAALPDAVAPVKAKRASKPKPEPVKATPAASEQSTTRKRVAKKPVESPAPVEAIAPVADKKPTRKRAAKKS